MNVSLNPLQSSLNNYSGLHLIVKPIVVLVLMIALGIFAALAIGTMAFGSSRRERRATTRSPLPSQPPSTDHLSPVGSLGTIPSPTGNSTPSTTTSTPQRTGSTTPVAGGREPYEIQYRPGLYENDRNGVYEIIIADKLQESSPDLQLRLLSFNILIYGILPNLQLRYLDDNLNSHISFDTGGMGRHYMTFLFKALKESTKSLSDNFLLHKNLLVPQREFLSEDLIPDRTMLDQPSQETLEMIDEAPLFYHLGALLSYVYLNPSAYLIGSIFHPAIFSTIFTLSPLDIDTPFNELPDVKKILMCKALIQAQIESGEEFKYLLPVLELLTKGEEATEEDIKNVESYYYNSCLTHAKEGEDQFIKADEEGCELDLEAIKQDKAGFLKSCLNYLLQQPTESLGTIGLILYPIHTMAKGMRAAAKDAQGRNLWTQIRPNPTSLRLEIDPENGIPDMEAVTRRAVDRLRLRIQGSLDRQFLVNKITYDDNCNEIVKQKGKFLEDWILRPETTDDQIEALLIVWTGSSTIDPDLSRRLNIEAQDIIYESGTNQIKYGFEPCPRSNSCFQILKFAPDWIEESFNGDGTPTGIPYDNTREGFYQMMEKFVTAGKREYKWTMH